MPDLIVLEHQPELAFACSTIVADSGDVFRAFPRQRLNQVIREARASKPPNMICAPSGISATAASRLA